MTFTDIPAGVSVFIDANTFVYHFIGEPNFGPACTQLLERVELLEIEGWTSPHVLAEVSHRLMTFEAYSLFAWPYTGIAARLRRHPAELQQLSSFQQSMVVISGIGLHMATVMPHHILLAAAEASRQHGLLTNDALVVTLMQEFGLTRLASNDADFDRVPWISRFAA